MFNDLQPKWKLFLETQQQCAYFQILMHQITHAYATTTCFPKWTDIFKVFKICDVDDIKCLIIGQDPYPKANHATGIAFGIETNNAQLPPTLKNIFQELADDVNVTNVNTDLIDWVKQGVFLINTVLTIQQDMTLSHAAFNWNLFTDEVFKFINHQCPHLIVVLWGKKALMKKDLFTSPTQSFIISSHPSLFSYHKGFKGSKPFSKINHYLMLNHEKIINW